MPAKIDLEKRAALSRLLREALGKRRWSYARLAEKAEQAARHAAHEQIFASDREICLEISVTRHHIARLLNCPAAPLGCPARRARLLGVALALGIELAKINRLAGGL